jgi:hypothetical protein
MTSKEFLIYCKDCRFARLNDKVWSCMHVRAIASKDLVTGHEIMLNCALARKRFCGVSAKFFEKK